MRKRLLSFVLAVLMIASLLPATALAADIVDSGTCGAEGDGSNLTWTLDSEGTLTISGTGAMKNYYWRDVTPWQNQGVKRVVITSGVTRIGMRAFFRCTDMTDITIPDSVTEIYIGAFSCCSSLTSIVIPDSVTRIDRETFQFCDSLTNITLPDSITYIDDYAFDRCYSLTGVVIPDSVKIIGSGAFFDCRSLTGIVIPDGVTYVDSDAFSYCSSLTSVVIPDSVTSIGDGVFAKCKSLTNVTIPDSVTSIGDRAFAGCTSLTDIAVSEESPYFCSQEGVVYSKDKKTIIAYPAGRESTTYAIAEGVTDIAGAFGGCTSLTAISIPESVTGIGSYAFSECTNLMEITIPECVTSIGDSAFWDCAKLESLAIPDCVTSIGAGAFRGCESLKSIAIPNGVTIIAERTFDGCKSLESITIPDTVTAVEGWAFNECNSLKDVYYLDEEYAWLHVQIKLDGNDAIWRKEVVHCFSKWTIETEPTCTELGSETSICSVKGCDKTFTRTVPALGHAWDDGVVTKPATETETGVKTFTCTRCGETRTETMPVLPHTHSYKAVVTAPTCTDKGYTTHTCACGDSYVDAYTDALGHAWDNGKVTKEPTGTETGVKTFTCTRCGETRTETMPVIPHVHSYKDVVTAPTCTAKGYTTHICVCGNSYVDTYTDALGHAWDNGKVTKEPTETETGVKTFTCTRCGKTKTESIPVVSVDVTQMFTDVTKNWAYPGIQYCVTHGIMGGMGDGTFAPTGTTTRAQIVQILYNLEGTPAVSGTTPFTDLTANWYKPAILWAYQNNVVAGTSPTTFAPDQPVTREQIAVILTQYMFNVLKMNRTWTPADLSTFPDGANVSSWAKEAMQDAVALGLINGTKAPDGLVYLDPQGSAARQQVATILMNFCQNVKK